MVLVNSVTENDYLIYPPDPAEVFFDDLGWKYSHLMTATGVARLFGETRMSHPWGLSTSERGQYPLSESLYQADLANRNHTPYCRAVANEEIANRREQIHSTPFQSVADLPLIVLTAGTDPTWSKLQDQLASLSTQRNHVVVKDGDHAHQFFQPEAVIDAVETMAKTVRSEH